VKYAEHISDLVGNTPLVKLNSVVEDAGVRCTVLAKIEYFNPGGSVKDRIALRMIEAAEDEGLLKPGGTIVEPTSGNTGVGLALFAQRRGYKCVFVCPDKVSQDKQDVLKAYGAEVVVCPTSVAPDHPDSYYSVSDRLVKEIDGAWKPNQYYNPEGPNSHYATTGPEIWGDTDGSVTHFIAGAGTGGTISGTGRYLKEVSDGAVRIIAADPEGSVYSCGMAVVAALRAAKGLPEESVVVVLLPDSGRGYMSKIFNDEWMSSYGFLHDHDEQTVGEVLRTKSGEMPALVHTHPNETIRDAVHILREFGVSQMPVVKAEPPVMSGEVAGSVSERALMEALFTGQAHLFDSVEKHMEPGLPLVGSGEPVGAARDELEKSDAILVVEDGKPVGVLTRADLLGFLAD